MIPVVGPVTSLVLVGLMAAPQGTFAALFLIGYALALRLSIDNLVGPLAGAMLLGIIGLLLAVPTAASIKLILQHYYAEPIEPTEAVELAPAPRRWAGSRGPKS